MTKKILVLGASHSQIDLIKKAKEMGFEVFSCGGKENEPGFALADHYKVFDIRNKALVEDYARESQVDFIFTMGLEMALPVIEAVSTSLGLPQFFSRKVLDQLADKGVWREALHGLPFNIDYRLAEKIEDLVSWTNYPAVVKPVDGSGQRGVIKVDNLEELKKAFPISQGYSKSGQVLMEKYIGGEEISVNSYMYQGKLAFAEISDRISYKEYPGGIIKEHHIPSKYNHLREEILSLVKEVNSRLGLENGHIYFQLKVYEGKPYVIEFTPRFDGCHMWNLIEKANGLDLRQVALEHLAYGKSDLLDQYQYHLNEGKFETHFLSLPPDQEVRREDFSVPKDVLSLHWYYENGQKVKKVTGYMEKLGYYIVKK